MCHMNFLFLMWLYLSILFVQDYLRTIKSKLISQLNQIVLYWLNFPIRLDLFTNRIVWNELWPRIWLIIWSNPIKLCYLLTHNLSLISIINKLDTCIARKKYLQYFLLFSALAVIIVIIGKEEKQIK